ncbi:pseudouridylate synthase-like protein, putative [Bodo saltans]|uniref:Pseudouridylate synthase-like protein, putative n=1 Tax=Bodo saltans TaxID=75058 RepID=A0A0S4KL20_BODSA|nr:pseudouridylate synthase-like protein, putative [Bodo saltans]|eukprot:CUI15277.1 pseudouridylate synthase-like protein, putative [Bodo saltans]
MGRQQGNRRVDNTFRPPKDHVHLSFCVAYVGTAFRGLQLQGHAPLHHTVEGAFVQALRAAGVLLKLERGRIADPHHYIGRSCRTDRGVHAVRNMISLFIPTERFHTKFLDSTDVLKSAVQAVLPPPINLLNVTRVMPTFSTKNCCNRRVYNYYIPVYAILDAKLDSWETLLAAYPEEAQQLFDTQAPHSHINLDENLLNVTRVMPTFSTKNCCNRRVYNYYIPVYAILDAKLDSWETLLAAYPEEAQQLFDTQAPHSHINLDESSCSSRSSKFLNDLTEKVGLLNQEVTSQFVGSNRFHNYSTDMDAGGKVQSKTISSLSDESVRMILRCQIAPRVYFLPTQGAGPSNEWLSKLLPPQTQEQEDASEGTTTTTTASIPEEVQKEIDFVRSRLDGRDGRKPLPATIPFVVFQVEGASFLLNMIRKMVGTLIAIARGVRASMVHDTLSPYKRTSNPLAPGPYLSLALSFYQGYDSVVRDMKEKAHVYPPLEETWHATGVDEAAASFFRDGVTRDLVDADLNRAIPLDTTLYLRDYVRSCDVSTKLLDDLEDAHLPSMKEYAPSKPHRCPPTASEMTVFLRLLRIHNWNIRPVEIPEKSKVAAEYANKLARRAEAAAATSSLLEGGDATSTSSVVASVTVNDQGKRLRDDDTAAEAASMEVPERIQYLDDGWIYVRNNLEDEQMARREMLRMRFTSLKQIQRALRSTMNARKNSEASATSQTTADDAEAEDLLNVVMNDGDQFGDGD